MMDPFQEILNTNGNNHHSKVVSKFRSLGWQSLVSPYYSDNFTDKAREIDVIVERDYSIQDIDRYDPLRVRFFLECKYIAQETVLWFDKKDMHRTRELLDSLFNAETQKYQYKVNTYHYGEDVPVAKLFGSKGGRAEENEVLSKAINQCLNAFIYYRNETTAPIPRGQSLSSTISYPVIVCNSFDKFRRASMSDQTAPLEVITEPFQLEVNYAYLDREKRPQNEFFLIDVITIDQIEDYIKKIEAKDVSEESSAIRVRAYDNARETSVESYDPYSIM